MASARLGSGRVRRRSAVLALATVGLAGVPGVAVGAPARSTAAACPAGAVPVSGLRDVGQASPHAATVDCLLWWGLTRGTGAGTYDPAGGVTRAQMASFLVRLLDRAGDVLPQSAPDRFPDDDGSPHETSIDRLAAAGITTGRPDGTYDPASVVTRAQMATFLARTAAQLSGQVLPAGGDEFRDDDGSPHEASINAVARAGIASGVVDGRYEPAAEVRRDQMASFLIRTADLVVAERGLGLLSVEVTGLPAEAPAPLVHASGSTGEFRRAAGPGVLALPVDRWSVVGSPVQVAGATWSARETTAVTVASGRALPANVVYASAPDRIADDVEALTGANALAVADVDRGTGRIRLDGAAAAGVDPGEVLVAEPSAAAPDGVLARVAERHETPEGVVLDTAPATLADVYPDGTAAPVQVEADTITFTPAAGVTVGDRAADQARPDRSASALDVTVAGATLRLHVDATVGLREPLPGTDPDRAWQPERGVFIDLEGPIAVTPVAQVKVGRDDVAIGIETRTSSSLKVGVGASVTAENDLEAVYRKELGRLTARGCSGLICATMEGSLVAVISATGELRYDVQLDTTGRMLAGIRVDEGGQRPWFERGTTTSVRPLGATGSGELELYTGADLALKLYGVAGPFVAGGAYASSGLELFSDGRPAQCGWEGGVRLTAGVRAELRLLGRGVHATAEQSHDWPLRGGSCTIPGVGGGSVTPAQLRSAPVPSLCDHPAGRLVDGRLPGLDPTRGHVALIDSQVADLDGDGRDEGIALLECTYGGNANYVSVHVYRPGPVHAGRADIDGDREIQRSRGVSLQGVHVVDGVLEVTALDGDTDDPTCCPSVILSRRFALTPTGLTALPARPPGLADPLTPDGWGSIRVGDPYETVALATGWAVDVDGIPDDTVEDCTYATFARAPAEMSGIGGDGRLGALATGDPRVRTPAGVGVGSSEAEVLTAYGSAARHVDNIYSDVDDVVVGPPGGRVLRFQLAEDRRVVYLEAGEEDWALLPEGCA